MGGLFSDDTGVFGMTSSAGGRRLSKAVLSVADTAMGAKNWSTINMMSETERE